MNTKKKLSFSSSTIAAGGNAKTIKGDKEYLTAIMYLAPWKTIAGQNSCSMAELAGCFKACLYTAGRGQMNNIQNARIRKTERFYDAKAWFLLQLSTDIERFEKYCKKNNVLPAVRLNGTSDIRWELLLIGSEKENIFKKHPNVQFYDYTKIANRKVKGINNYHLTFSYSEADEKYRMMYKTAIKRDMNVAVVFRSADSIPKEFLGMPVIDGDADDLRFLDKKGVVVGLYAKGKGKKDTSGFVVDYDKNKIIEKIVKSGL